MRLIFSILLVATALANARALDFSYLYIQGDKKTPIYVKLEGDMMPRFGKNYCIIPQLAPGPTHISVLFQQNLYPEQQFTIVVPEHGSRYFLLAKRDTAFALYDLQQHFYLRANNDASEDHVPEKTNRIPLVVTTAGNPGDTTIVVKEHTPAADTTPPGPSFIEGVHLRKDSTDSTLVNTGNEGNQRTAIPADTLLKNSDCPEAMSSERFSALYKEVLGQNGDEDRLKTIIDKTGLCFAGWQVRTLCSILQTDAARFTFLKKVFPRVTDQGTFALLDDLLRDQAWKNQFQQLVYPRSDR